MTGFVFDASVAVKWVVPEPHSDAALALLTDGATLHAPGHWLAETATVLWAKCAIHNVMDRSQADARLAFLRDLAVIETPVAALLPAAFDLAFDLRLTCYDTLYLALARRVGARLVTADRRLFDAACANPGTAAQVTWVGDLPG